MLELPNYFEDVIQEECFSNYIFVNLKNNLISAEKRLFFIFFLSYLQTVVASCFHPMCTGDR